MDWLTPFRWLHDRLHAEDRKRPYPHVTVPDVPVADDGNWNLPTAESWKDSSDVSPSVHYLGRINGV